MTPVLVEPSPASLVAHVPPSPPATRDLAKALCNVVTDGGELGLLVLGEDADHSQRRHEAVLVDVLQYLLEGTARVRGLDWTRSYQCGGVGGTGGQTWQSK